MNKQEKEKLEKKKVFLKKVKLMEDARAVVIKKALNKSKNNK